MKKLMRRTIIACSVLTALTLPALAGPSKVTIGGIVLLSGKYGTYGQQVSKGMEIAAKRINNAGGLATGAKIELDVEDSGSDSAQAVTLLRKFAGTPEVMAVAGPIGTPDLLAIMPLSSQAGLPILSIASSTDFPPNRFGKYLVRVSLRETPDVLHNVLERVAKAKKLQTIGLLQDRTNDFAQAEARAFRKALAGTDLKLLGAETYAGGDKDFAAVLDKVTRDHPDALWLAGFAQEVAPIMMQARARGFKGVFLGGAGLTDPTIAKLAQSAATGAVTFLPFNSHSDAQATKDLVAGYKAAGGQGDPPNYTAYGYDAIMLLANAVKAAGSTDREKVMAALGATKDLPLTTGVYSFAGKGDNVAPPKPFIVQIGAAGAFEPLPE